MNVYIYVYLYNNIKINVLLFQLEPNMTESFIMAAFNRLGQRPLAVKVMRNKFTGEPAGYAFVHFQVLHLFFKLKTALFP